MTTATNASIDWNKRDQAERLWRQVLAEVSRSGVYGTAGIEVTVSDGRIQNIRRRVEQMER